MTDLADLLPRPLAFVMSGGASIGAAQVGMVRSLVERNVRPDFIVGTSVGAINGAAIASGWSDAVERLELIWHDLDRKTIFGTGMAQLLRARRKGHVFEDEGLRSQIREHMVVPTFEELEIPLTAVATNVTHQHRELLESGSLETALMASTAIPGVYPFVKIHEDLFCDGGLVDNVPLGLAAEKGAASIVVLDCGAGAVRGRPPETLEESVIAALSVTLVQQLRSDLNDVADELPVVFLPGQPNEVINPMDFSRTSELIERAERMTDEFLDTLKIDGPGLYCQPRGWPTPLLDSVKIVPT